MTQKGVHTWDITFDYQKCPSCGFINEDRQLYHQKNDSLTKEIKCVKCAKTFEVVKKKVKRFGPLFGSNETVENMWE